MDWELMAPMITAIAFFVSVAGVLIFRPLTKRLGDLIEITARDRGSRLRPGDLTRLTEVVDRLADRIDHLEERQDFSERMLATLQRGRERPALGEPNQL